MAQARIYRPSKSAMQSGRGKTKTWVLEYEQATPRRPDPLMGWSSADDTLNEVKLLFQSQDEAVAFAKKEGFDYVVLETQESRFKPKTYADNFRFDRPH